MNQEKNTNREKILSALVDVLQNGIELIDSKLSQHPHKAIEKFSSMLEASIILRYYQELGGYTVDLNVKHDMVCVSIEKLL